jgi:hypothetical protein
MFESGAGTGYHMRVDPHVVPRSRKHEISDLVLDRVERVVESDMRFSFGEAVVMAWPEISYSRNIYRNVI